MVTALGGEGWLLGACLAYSCCGGGFVVEGRLCLGLVSKLDNAQNSSWWWAPRRYFGVNLFEREEGILVLSFQAPLGAHPSPRVSWIISAKGTAPASFFSYLHRRAFIPGPLQAFIPGPLRVFIHSIHLLVFEVQTCKKKDIYHDKGNIEWYWKSFTYLRKDTIMISYQYLFS